MHTIRLSRNKLVIVIPVMAAIAGLALSGTVYSNGVSHQIHVGGPDICSDFGFKPGCDKNFSLTAVQFADGSVRGQYVDRFGGRGGQGFHATLNCLHVVDLGFGKIAWVSGIISKGMSGDDDVAGQPVWTAAIDLATAANDEPRDIISFSVIGDPTPCYEEPNFVGFQAFQGQVTIK